MHEGRRPGGLTALAVLNFVGSGLDMISIVGLIAAISLGGVAADSIERNAKARAERGAKEGTAEPKLTKEEQEALAAMRGFERIGRGTLAAYMGLVVACAGVLVAAGVGYLRQRRWGRLLGNVYVVLSITAVVVEMSIIPKESGGGFRFAALVNFIYPLATLFFLNTTFREDLRN